MKKLLLLKLPAFGAVYLLPLLTVLAQSSGTPAVPPTKPGIRQPDGPTAVISLSSGSSVTARSKKGRSELVGLRKNEVVDVKVHYPTGQAGRAVDVVAVDGGRVLGPSSKLTVANDGTVQFRFKVENDSGLYQVSVYDGTQELGLQFWVLDDDPRKNPVVINP